MSSDVVVTGEGSPNIVVTAAIDNAVVQQTPTPYDITVYQGGLTLSGEGVSYEQSFAQSNLTVANRLIVNHNQGTDTPDVTLYNPAGIQFLPDALEISNANTVIVDLDAYCPLSGTYKIKVQP